MVLPDCDAARDVAAALGSHAPQTLPHPSGRPWLMGCWAADELVAAQAGETQVVVTGCCPVTTTALSDMAHRVRTVAGLDRLGARPDDLAPSDAVADRVQGDPLDASGLVDIVLTTKFDR